MNWYIKPLIFLSLVSCADQQSTKDGNDNKERKGTTPSGLTYMILKQGTALLQERDKKS